ncbi:unnamed protein product [Schistosoma margrebowiei]|uniref:Uncharacterized protein n=1 Tax=Schistosoma margrebowiei TaxID=48269 RepID=A0A3P8HBX6_9TREM|nr:unnamed protein product [Schistosoma margrebowiei]
MLFPFDRITGAGGSVQITSHFTLTACKSARSSCLTSFSILGISTKRFLRVLRNRRCKTFFNGGVIP